MKLTGSENRKKRLRGALLFAAAFFICLSPVFRAYADVTSDSPQLSDDPVISDEPDLPGVQDNGSGSSSGNSSETSSSGGDSSGNSSGNSSGRNSSGTSGSGSGGAVITDTPQLDGGSSADRSSSGSNTGNTENSTDTESNADTGNSVNTGKRTDTESGTGSGADTETGTVSKDKTALSDTPSAGGSSSGGVISTAPVTGKTGTSSEAPVTEKTEADDAAVRTGSSGSTAASVSAGPSSGNQNTAAGSVYANDAVTRISLDYYLVTPMHVKGNLHVARAAVQLEDGSWQTFDYKDNIHFAFYRMKDTRTDSSGTTWYIADVTARRFGDQTTGDGEFKSELWLNAADCIARSTIDVNTTDETRIAIVKAALSMLGKRYTYGAGGPDAFDCSGLVKYVCKQAGISVPRTSTQLLQLDGQITAAELRPGDIMARAGHCGIYIGNGIFVHASDSSVGVVAEYLSVYNLSNKFTNYINVVGD